MMPTALPRLIAAVVLLAAPGAAFAQALSCPAETACRNDACTAGGDLGAQVVPLGAEGVGLASNGPPRPVESVSRGEGPAMVVTWYTPDASEMIAIRAGDLGFTYRRRIPEGWLILRGACRPQ